MPDKKVDQMNSKRSDKSRYDILSKSVTWYVCGTLIW